MLRDAGVTLLGSGSLEAALDIDWSDSAAQTEALARLLGEVDRLEQWVTRQVPVAEAPPVQAALAALRRVLTQDLEPYPTTGHRRIRRGVAAERMPSLGDPEMRHGRKTRTRLFTGYKRHVIKLVDADVIVGALVRPANEPEHEALALLTPDLAPDGPLAELLIDRGYLSSLDIGALHARGVAIRAKRGRVPIAAGFRSRRLQSTSARPARVTCPAQQTAPIVRGAATVHFAAAVCQPCSLRAACTTARRGRSVAIYPQEALLQSLRAHQQQPDGRTQLRQRTTIEHSLARIDHIQGPKARYKGLRKNTLDVRRVAVVANRQRIARFPAAA